jgi:pyridoxamine 5'-phosphate oxidase
VRYSLPMLTQDVIDFANRIRACWFSTCEGDQPHVRGMAMWYADRDGFYFHTGSVKRVAEQIRKNPKVEIAFYQPGEMGKDAMLRVTGRVRILPTEDHRDRLIADRPWLLEELRKNPGTELVVFVVEEGELQRWDMAVNCRERDQPSVTF